MNVSPKTEVSIERMLFRPMRKTIFAGIMPQRGSGLESSCCVEEGKSRGSALQSMVAEAETSSSCTLVG